MFYSRLPMSFRLGCAALACALHVSPAQAQTRFRGRPLPECRSFWITEAGVSIGQPEGAYFTWELGHMVNVSQRLALGGTLIGIWDTSAARAGAKLRARWWLNRRLSVDVSPGLILWDHRFEADPPGFAAHVGLNYADLIAATGQVESIKGVGGGRYVGLKAGSYAGLIVFAVSAIGAGIGLLAYAAAG